jgi:hypothetical protein
MERHVERLIASCGLAHFSYRSWPSTEILPPAPVQAAEVAEPPALPAESLLVVAEAAPLPVATAEAPPVPEAPGGARGRSLLASLSRLLDDAPPRVPLPAAPPLQRAARARGPLTLPSPEGFEAPIHVGYQQPRSPHDRRQAALPSAEAAGEATDRSARTARPAFPTRVARAEPAAPGRRFALLEEMLPGPFRRADRRGTSSPSTH